MNVRCDRSTCTGVVRRKSDLYRDDVGPAGPECSSSESCQDPRQARSRAVVRILDEDVSVSVGPARKDGASERHAERDVNASISEQSAPPHMPNPLYEMTQSGLNTRFT